MKATHQPSPVMMQACLLPVLFAVGAALFLLVANALDVNPIAGLAVYTGALVAVDAVAKRFTRWVGADH